MRDRLIELIDYIREHPEKTCPQFNSKRRCKGCKYEELDDCASSRLADYFLENGVIVPPCKVGDTVYRVVVMSTGVTRVVKKTLCPPYKSGVIVNINPTIKRFIRSVLVTKNNFFDVIENFGKTVFLTKEEAEQALKGGAE